MGFLVWFFFLRDGSGLEVLEGFERWVFFLWGWFYPSRNALAQGGCAGGGSWRLWLH